MTDEGCELISDNSFSILSCHLISSRCDFGRRGWRTKTTSPENPTLHFCGLVTAFGCIKVGAFTINDGPLLFGYAFFAETGCFFHAVPTGTPHPLV
jgi:hypothetical protein